MYLFAHIGYTLAAAEFLSIVFYYLIRYPQRKIEIKWGKWGWKNFSVWGLIIGGLGPDIIDKSISFPLTGYSRYIAHSLVFDVIISFIAIVIFRKKKDLWKGFVLGWQMHILLDIKGFIPWFYPIVNYEFQERTKSLWETLLVPYNYINEIIGIILIFGILLLYYRRKLLRISKLFYWSKQEIS